MFGQFCDECGEEAQALYREDFASKDQLCRECLLRRRHGGYLFPEYLNSQRWPGLGKTVDEGVEALQAMLGKYASFEAEYGSHLA
jgi:hypothetical protein